MTTKTEERTSGAKGIAFRERFSVLLLLSLGAALALPAVSAAAGQPPQVAQPFDPVIVAQDTNAPVSVELASHFTDPDTGDILSYSVRIATPTDHLPDRVSEARYRTVHQELLYTHTGQSRSRNSPQRLKARDNLAAQLGRLGLTVTLEPFQYLGTLHNLVAEKRGVVRPDDIFVVGAHLDSANDNCPGADDDASGLAALLEVATALQPFACAATIRFVVFDAEENQMQGSLAYAAEHVQHERILGMINLEDLAYNPPGATHDVVKVAAMRDPNDGPLQAALIEAFNAQGFGRGVVADADQENGADSLPFSLLGIPGVVVYEPNATEGSYYHQPTDAVETPGLMDYAHCAKVSGGVAGALGLLAGLAGAPNAVSHTLGGSTLVLSFVPGQYGVAEVTVRATDPAGLYTEATFRVTVTPVNGAPVARDDAAVVPANGALAIDVLANDEDSDLGEVLTIASVGAPTAGTAAINADRRVLYTPPNGFTGAASFTYTVRDIAGAVSSTATVQLTVRANTAPTAVADTYSVNEDETLRLEAPGVLANDSDADGEALGAVLVQGPAHGVLTLERDGAFTYRGARDYAGPDAFTYSATDPLGATSAPVAVSLAVQPVDDNPVAVPGPDLIVEDQDGNGSEAVILDGAASYHPDPEDHIVAWRWRLGATLLANGAASRVVLPVGVQQVSLEVEDQAGRIGQAPLTVTVTGSAALRPGLYGEYFVLGGAPTAIPDLVPLVPDWVRVEPAIDFPAAAVPWPDLPAGTAQGFAARWSGTVEVPVAGNWTFATTSADGSRLYLDETLLVDNDGLHGMTRQSGSRDLAAGRHALRVEYFHRTGPAGCVVSWQAPGGTEVTIPGTALAHANAAPVARDMALVFSQRVAYSATEFNLDVQDAESPLCDALACVIVRPLAHSSLGFPYIPTLPYGSCRLEFIPDPAWVGTDSFTFQATDPQGRRSRLATCTITVVANSAPVAKDMSLVLLEGTVSTTFALAATDQDDSPSLLVPILVAAPAHGTVTLGASVANPCTYEPTPGYVGADEFTFQVRDPQGLLSAVGTCAIAIRPNAVPVAQNQTVVGYRELGTPAGRKLLFTDPDPQAWTFAVVAGPAHGSLTAFSASAGTFTYQPNAGYTGTDAFTWTVSDGLATSSPATASIVLRDPASRQGDLVQLVVDERVRVPLATEIGRLRDDLVNEGYTAEIVPWPAASTVAALWNHLRTVWTDPARPLVGAILIGSLPQPISERSQEGPAPDDLVYWNLRTFDLGNPERSGKVYAAPDYQIWVSRIGVEDPQWGDEVTLIRRALDANHAYRTGRSRLPHTAYAYSAFNTMPGGSFQNYFPEQLLEIWPAVLCHTESEFGGGGSGVHRARFLPARTDLDDGAADALVAGGEIFVEDSHGIRDAYICGAFSTWDLYRYIAQQRFVLASSCVSGAPGGVVNNHLFTRGGGCVYAVGASVPSIEGSFVLCQRDLSPGQLGPVRTRCRSLLARRESWGRSLLDSYYMKVNNKTIHYGDLSLPVKASPANAVPDLESFMKTPDTVAAGQPVTFSVAVADPDGTGEKNPEVPFRHQLEWFMNGYNYGRNHPTYVTDDTQGGGWTSVTHTFPAAGTYTIRVEVMDEWQARGWREMTVTATVKPLLGDLNNDGVVNAIDLQIVIANFGKTVADPGCDTRADANADGVVNALDLQIVIANFGKTVP